MSALIAVKDVMTRRLRTISSSAKVSEAAAAMSKLRVGSLVLEEGGKPVGIITEGDISRCVARGLDPKRTSVRLGRKRLITIDAAEKVEVAAKLMAERKVKKLPVTSDGRLVGMITQTDIVDSTFSIVTSLKEMVASRYSPPDFEP